MKNRAKKELCRLADDEIFREISTGLSHILEVVNRLDRSARRLPGYGRFYTKSIHSHAVHLLGSAAEEEAAKFLILLDFVRCPRSLQKPRSRQLGYFYDHLAKGIYAEYCSWRPVDFAEVAHHVDLRRQAFYLDGPLGVDWIFNNDILNRRVDRLYVNYVGDDDGNCYWQYPHPEDFMIGYHTHAVIEIARALHAVGVATPEGLASVAEIWRKVKVVPKLAFDEVEALNVRTLQFLHDKGLLRDTPPETHALIEDRWSFPLYTLDLSLDPPTANRKAQEERFKELQEIQEQWTPDY